MGTAASTAVVDIRPGAVARRPAVAAAGVFAAGIFLHPLLPALPIVWLIVIGLLLILAIRRRNGSGLASFLIALSLLFSGVLIAQLEAFYYPRNDISAYATDRPRLAQLELQIDHEPRVLADPYSPHPMPPKQVVTARVVRVKTWRGWVDSSGGILVQIVQPNPRLAINQRVRVMGMLERPAPASNPGQFDWAAYYREQRILTSLHVPAAGNITILSQAGNSPIDWIRQSSRRLLAAGFPSERSLDHALLRALLLGDSDPELRDVQEQFRRTGTSHHLSISGMHVAVLGGFIYGICRLLRLRPRASTMVMLVFTTIYGIAALPSPPVVRSILLCLFFGIGLIGRRSLDSIQLLAISVLAMLVWHPLDLYNAGFQLSFGTVLGLMLFTGPLIEWFSSLRRDDPALPMTHGAKPANFAITGARWIESSMTSAFAAGLVAWMVSMPLIAYHFEQLNPWAIPASIILAPVVLVALIGGLAKVTLTLLFPSLAGQWALLAAEPMAWMRHMLEWLTRLPGSDFPMPQWPLWWLAVVYGFYLLTLVPWPRPKLRLCMRLAPFGVVAMAIVVPLRSIERVVKPDELKFTLLAIGAGQVGVLETPAGRTVMIDAGSTSLSDPLRKCIGPFLRGRGTTRIDTLILTHTDIDHTASAGAICGVHDVGEVLVGGRFRQQAGDSATAEALLKTLDSIDLPPRIVAPGDRFPLGRGVEVEILWPPARGQPLSPNDAALVARISYAGRSILITGDIQDVAQNELLKHPESLHADVLIAPHHGSNETTTADFVRVVDPQFVLSSNDRSLTGKQKRFRSMIGNRPLYRTNECGAITVRIGKDGTIQVDSFQKSSSRP